MLWVAAQNQRGQIIDQTRPSPRRVFRPTDRLWPTHTVDRALPITSHPFGVLLRSLIFPVFETTAVNPKSSPESSLMITVDSPLISTSSGDIQRALLKVGRTTLPTLFKDALKAVASLARKSVSRSS